MSFGDLKADGRNAKSYNFQIILLNTMTDSYWGSHSDFLKETSLLGCCRNSI